MTSDPTPTWRVNEYPGAGAADDLYLSRTEPSVSDFDKWDQQFWCAVHNATHTGRELLAEHEARPSGEVTPLDVEPYVYAWFGPDYTDDTKKELSAAELRATVDAAAQWAAARPSVERAHTHMLWKGTDVPGILACAECGHEE